MKPVTEDGTTRRVAPLLIFALLPFLGACSDLQRYDWTEDVRLMDGRMLTVHRSEQYRKLVDPGQGFTTTNLLVSGSLSATLPAPIEREVAFEGSVTPLALDVSSGNAYLVCFPTTAASIDEWKMRPRELYVIFVWRESGWRRISIEQLPRDIQPNLLPGGYSLFIKGDVHSGAHIDLVRKQVLIDGLQLRSNSRLKNIVRPQGSQGGEYGHE